MICSLLLVLLGLGFQDDASGIKASLATGDYRTALSFVGALTDPTTRALARSKILYDAGDPAGAWSSAQAGLVMSPTQLDLLYYSAAAALWLQQTSEACEMTERLGKAVAAADTQPPEEHSAWLAASAEFARRCDALRLHEEALCKAASIAKGLSLVVVALALGASVAGARHYGRSSRPVS